MRKTRRHLWFWVAAGVGTILSGCFQTPSPSGRTASTGRPIVGGSPDTILYHLASHGPDTDHDDDELLSDPQAAVHYDPTNGTVSNGDIVYLGPGHGFNE